MLIVFITAICAQGAALAGQALQQGNATSGVQSKTKEAQSPHSLSWYQEQAEAGSALAQLTLGLMYESGEGVAQDDTLAAEWTRKAAEQDYADAQLVLAIMTQNGRSMPRDDAQAFAWNLKAAEQGNADAQFNLGYAYECGLGVLKDLQQAIA